MRRWTVGFVAAGVLLVGCGGDDPDGTTAGGPTAAEATDGRSAEEGDSAPAAAGTLPHGLVRCDPDAPLPTAAEELYLGDPVYVGNEQPVEEVRAWASQQPGYVDIWIDRDHEGWVGVGFSEGAEERQAEIAERFPGEGVVAVPLDWTAEEIQALGEDVRAALGEVPGVSSSVSPVRGLVEVAVPVLDEATLAPLAPFAGDRLCVVGTEPADAVADGPQPTEGAGWRLLGEDLTGQTYRTGVATTDAQLAALWSDAGLPGDPPAVDWEAEIAVWFGAVYGSGCEIRLDDVVVDREAALVHGEIVLPGNPTACNDDANPHSYVVAVERSALPEGPFVVQLSASDPPAGVPEERTLVAVDLSAPGATATDDEIGTDPALVDAPDQGYRFEPGGVVEPGYPAELEVDLGCDLSVVGPINGTTWATDDPAAVPRTEWIAAAAPNPTLVVEVLLEEGDPPSLTLTAAGASVRYSPSRELPPAC